MKYLMYFLVLLYVLCAIVQYNDPDPLVWILAYLLPASICFYRSKGKGDATLYLALGLLYVLWAINQFPPQWEGLMFENLSMKTINVELGRESLGLGLCAIGMFLCAIKK
jgi:hypothetical protein